MWGWGVDLRGIVVGGDFQVLLVKPGLIVRAHGHGGEVLLGDVQLLLWGVLVIVIIIVIVVGVVDVAVLLATAVDRHARAEVRCSGPITCCVVLHIAMGVEEGDYI